MVFASSFFSLQLCENFSLNILKAKEYKSSMIGIGNGLGRGITHHIG